MHKHLHKVSETSHNSDVIYLLPVKHFLLTALLQERHKRPTERYQRKKSEKEENRRSTLSHIGHGVK